MRLFDTHAHLNSEHFAEQVDEVVDRAKKAGLEGVIVIGVDYETSIRACDLAAEYPGFLYAAIGIQPNSVGEAKEGDFDRVSQLAAYPGVRAIGETGLDCYWDDTPLEMQRVFFDQHIDLCHQTGLPMVVHMRDSGDEIVEQLKAHDLIPAGVMHSFTGDLRLADHCLELGLHISFAGMVTFKNNPALREVAKMVPNDRILIETDSPYLSPEPFEDVAPMNPSGSYTFFNVLLRSGRQPLRNWPRSRPRNAKRLFQLP